MPRSNLLIELICRTYEATGLYAEIVFMDSNESVYDLYTRADTCPL